MGVKRATRNARLVQYVLYANFVVIFGIQNLFEGFVYFFVGLGKFFVHKLASIVILSYTVFLRQLHFKTLYSILFEKFCTNNTKTTTLFDLVEVECYK